MLRQLDVTGGGCHAWVGMTPHRAADGGRRVAAYYDRLAAVYGEGAYAAARRAAVLASIAGEIGAARAVLDVGCGNGAFLAALAAPGVARRVVGMDLSTEMLHVAQHRALATVDLVRADAMALPARTETFDLVFMSHVLLLIANVDAYLAGAQRVLRPGGTLVATVGASGWPDIIRQLLGAERIQELEAAFGSVSVGLRRDEPAAVAAACRRVGFQPTWRRADFSVSWPALEEWVRLRWLGIVDEALRVRADRWLASIPPHAVASPLLMAETLLVAHKLPCRAIPSDRPSS